MTAVGLLALTTVVVLVVRIPADTGDEMARRLRSVTRTEGSASSRSRRSAVMEMRRRRRAAHEPSTHSDTHQCRRRRASHLLITDSLSLAHNASISTVSTGDGFKTFIPRRRHLPRRRCQDTKRAKTFRIRLRRD